MYIIIYYKHLIVYILYKPQIMENQPFQMCHQIDRKCIFSVTTNHTKSKSSRCVRGVLEHARRNRFIQYY